MRGMGAMGGMGGLMAQAQKMQAKLTKANEEVDAMVFEGTAANGAVTVTMTGAMACQGVKIDPSVIDPEDPEMLEDLVSLAIGDCITKIKTKRENYLQQVMPMPAGMKFPF